MPLDKTPQLFFSMSMTMQQLRRSTLGSLANPTISFKSNFSWAPEKLGTAPGPASQEGDLHAARQDATAVFLNVDDNATVEKVHIGIPGEPDDFVQEQFQLGTREAWNSTWTRKSRR